MKNTSAIIAFVFILSFSSIAQNFEDKFWSPVKETAIRITGKRQIVPQKFLTYKLDTDQLKKTLFSAPHEKNSLLQVSPSIISLPLPDGTVQKFRVVESPVMAEELGAAFPDFKTFSVRGIDDPYANGKLDWNTFGFHGMILTPNGDFFIDPYCVGNIENYITYYTEDFVKPVSERSYEVPLGDSPESQKKEGHSLQKTGSQSSSVLPADCAGEHLKTYRIAVACTGEYAVAATGSATPTVAQTLAKIVTTVNRVDGVYEKEIAVRLVLIPTETLVIFTNAGTDPFNGNNNASTLLVESQSVITSTIGSANFDIGHTFSTGGGGVANLAVVCNNANKARGVTGSANPVGDPYDIDYVAHEVGHQFGGDHTFNAITDNCNFNRNGGTSVEPGSGITIMAYAGICSVNNIANNSIPYFHAISFDQIVNFTTLGTGSTCPVTTTTGNNPPLVAGSGNYIVPKSTPFILTGGAVDPDGDPLTFSWEETDAGTAAGNWNSGTKPFFRSYAPVTTPTRLFPRLQAVLNGNYTGVIGEYVPPAAQVLNFRLTARDNKMGGGGVCYAASTVTVDNSGPLTVTYPNASGVGWPINVQKTITWDVNGTDQGAVDCDSVRIWLSYNSGATYSILVNSTPNDGSKVITVPTLTTVITTCRIKIESIGNIFYDINNNDFTISTDPFIGIAEMSLSNSVDSEVWPNPVSSKLQISASKLNSKSATVINIVDVMGRTVSNVEFRERSELQESLDVSEWSKGVYFVKITNGSKQSVHRLIKD